MSSPRPQFKARVHRSAKCAAFCVFVFGSMVGFAAPPLPPADALQRAVESAADVQIARARLAEAQYEATLDALGPYEWSLSVGNARRRVEGEGSFQEWDTAVARTIRLPGKARLDRKIGHFRVEQATAELAVAVRSAHNAILGAWFGCVHARERVRLLEQDLQFVQATADAVTRRRRAGDLAELDDALAAAELASVKAEATARQIDAISAARLLATRLDVVTCDLGTWDLPLSRSVDFPASMPAARRALSDPVVRANEAAAERAAVTATRAQRERWPDPTLGVTYGRERDGVERIGGLTLSVPLGVRRRTAEAARANAASAAAAAELAAMRLEVERRWIEVETDAQRAHESWSALAEAERQQRRAAALSQRAFELGEASLTESLIVRRAALQASLAERAAALEAWRARAVYKSFVASLPETVATDSGETGRPSTP